MRELLALVVCSVAWCAGAAFEIQAISNRPDKISGGDVLVRVTIPEDAASERLASVATVRLNGTVVTGRFRAGIEPNTYLALLTGLPLGRSSVEVLRNGEDEAAAQLEIVNHPITGPVFSGPQQQPFICQTEDFKLPDGSTLGSPLDPNCSARTSIMYLYRSTAPDGGRSLKVLSRKEPLPTDVATTKIVTGEVVPYIVRVETGTINRAIYQIAVLHDPFTESTPDPLVPLKGWNQRLLYSFGGGCTEGWYRQGANTALGINAVSTGNLTDAVLRGGYAYASSSLNVFGNNCQDVTAAETMMMVKEHFVEHYGVPLFTFGRGGSGGAYQQIQIADNYPGLLDGIIPSATFPDVLATIQYLTDAQLLKRYFEGAGAELTNEQKLAIAGVGVLPSITRVSSGAGRIHPRTFCPPALPETMRYHPATNPSGARCDVFDHTANVYGRDPATGFARRPLDNTGVQYGLAALNAGVISPAEFLDLNEHIGGYDHDGNVVKTRSLADAYAVRAAYTTGRVTNGGGGLASIPILDLRGYLDRNANGDLHMKYHSFGLRERLVRANGTAANSVLLVTGSGRPGIEEYTIAKMDEWLTALAQDASTDRALTKIARAKPSDLVDGCYGATGERITETQTFRGGECNKLYPTYPSPRMVAGGPVSNDILKCQLKPVDFKDYRMSFRNTDRSRLLNVFRTGVCDWSRPGFGQSKLAGPWQSY